MSGFPLRMPPADADQQHRLAVFKREHPDVIIGPIGFDAWQARMREPDGETTVSRHALRDLLDRLDEILSGNTEGLSSPPGALQPPRVPRARTAASQYSRHRRLSKGVAGLSWHTR